MLDMDAARPAPSEPKKWIIYQQIRASQCCTFQHLIAYRNYTKCLWWLSFVVVIFYYIVIVIALFVIEL